ncbi:GntR family transcriptional regulator [Terracidiphilus gabretensis]|jgi:DNA-binding transcriptional regulator YhcF (GntR family)|uniref:GntR family transcriptional regulator n=1 Tax=Terracidiphilus gabretensis TaxID=1577687 RepID=UPI00071BF71E|nr:GntR family transcriptional regulator [Terracidiphilus gabretensis]
MQFWLNRTGEVSLREQLTTQIVLGILSRDLRAGERLPSTRELARRFGIHANTASAAYRQLEREGWLEFRHGSGVYVRTRRPETPETPERMLDALLGELVVKARRQGLPDLLVRSRLLHWLQTQPPGRWLVIEPDAELRRVVMTEMEQALALPVTGCAPEECGRNGTLDGAMAIVLPSKAATVKKLLPAGAELTVLDIHPVAPALGKYLPAPAGALIGIASRWSEFQRIARTMLIATGISPDAILVRDAAARSAWKRGLAATAAVVCDVPTAAELPKDCHAIVFRLLSEAAITQLRNAEETLGVTAAKVS